MPTTAPTGSLELVAGVLAHHAARGDTPAARRLLGADLHTPSRDRRLTAVRAEAGRIARNSPTPAVFTGPSGRRLTDRAIDLVLRRIATDAGPP